MQLEVSAAPMQVTVSAANKRVTIFIVIMQMAVSVAVMQVVCNGTVVSYAPDCFHCNYEGDSFFISMYVTASSKNSMFLSLTASFHKIDRKTFKGIVSGLHFTTIVNILRKLR